MPSRELHVLNTHKKNERWLKKHPNLHFHFTPTWSLWLNQVETWFSILQGQSLTGASFTSVEQLQEHIDAVIAAYNETAVPFAWTKKRVHQRRFKNRRDSEYPSSGGRPARAQVRRSGGVATFHASGGVSWTQTVPTAILRGLHPERFKRS